MMHTENQDEAVVVKSEKLLNDVQYVKFQPDPNYTFASIDDEISF